MSLFDVFVIVNTVLVHVGTNLEAGHLSAVLHSLLSGLQGRVWEGKESLLKALGSVCKSCSSAILIGQPSPDEVSSSLVEHVSAVVPFLLKANSQYCV